MISKRGKLQIVKLKMPKQFQLSTLVTAAILVGFLGFGIGYNYPALTDWVSMHVLHKSTASGLPQDLDYASVEEVYDALKGNFAGSLDATKLLDGAKKGLAAAAGDPYTVYLTKTEAKTLQSDLNGTFSGIGAEIAAKNGRIVIVAPLAGSPAKTAGLEPGDIVSAIDGVSTDGLSVDEAVSKIRGPAGSEVKLTIERGSKTKEYSIKRALITVPSVNSSMKPASVGYIQIIRFGDQTETDFDKAALKLKNDGAKSIILDLRDNPGGLLDSAVAIADQFLDVGKIIVDERKDDQVINRFRSQAGGVLVGLPVVVLINKGSASASEIIAGALHDNGVAKLVGETSFGKGSVQQLIELSGQAFLKVTIARWYTPAGVNISEQGITPDLKASLTKADIAHGRDSQLAKAEQLLQ